MMNNYITLLMLTNQLVNIIWSWSPTRTWLCFNWWWTVIVGNLKKKQWISDLISWFFLRQIKSTIMVNPSSSDNIDAEITISRFPTAISSLLYVASAVGVSVGPACKSNGRGGKWGRKEGRTCWAGGILFPLSESGCLPLLLFHTPFMPLFQAYTHSLAFSLNL